MGEHDFESRQEAGKARRHPGLREKTSMGPAVDWQHASESLPSSDSAIEPGDACEADESTASSQVSGSAFAFATGRAAEIPDDVALAEGGRGTWALALPESDLAAPGAPRIGRSTTGALSSGEWQRRVWHILPGLLPFALFVLPHPDPLSWRTRFVVLGIALLITGLIVRNYRRIARPGETQWLVNVLSYPATAVSMVFLFPGHAEFAAVVVIVLALGDGSATLFGLLYGRRALPWNPNKTWVGFGSFVLCSAPVAMLALWCEARPTVSLQYAIIVGATAVALAAIAESLPTKLTDNLRSGVAAAVGVVAGHAAMTWWM